MYTKHFLLIFFILASGRLAAQNTDFFGKTVDQSICPVAAGSADKGDAMAALNKICSAADIPNNFTLVPCPDIGNCYALYKDGVSYIVYDPAFFKRVQTFGFTEKNLPGSIDWASLTILAHELGHHLCQHTTNPALASKYTRAQLELQADEFAGSIMYKLGATLAQAQKAMYSDGVTDVESATHPSRKDRLAAIAKGYNKYAKNATPTEKKPTNQKITFIIPKFQIIASNVRSNIAEQMKQILVTDMENEGSYDIIVSSYDIDNYKDDPAVAYGGDQAIRMANYVLLAKIISYDEKAKKVLGGFVKVSGVELGTTIHYGFSFEVIDAKTNQLVLAKNWEFKANGSGSGYNANLSLDADAANEYDKKLQQVINYIISQKSKIVFN